MCSDRARGEREKFSVPSERHPDAAATTLDVRVTPRASRDLVVGWSGDILLLAAALEIPRRRVAVVGGLRDRHKQVVVQGLTRGQIRERIGA